MSVESSSRKCVLLVCISLPYFVSLVFLQRYWCVREQRDRNRICASHSCSEKHCSRLTFPVLAGWPMNPPQPHPPLHISFLQHSCSHGLLAWNFQMCSSPCLEAFLSSLHLASAPQPSRQLKCDLSQTSPTPPRPRGSPYNTGYSSFFPVTDPSRRVYWEFHSFTLDPPYSPSCKPHEGRHGHAILSVTISRFPARRLCAA